MVWPFNLFSSSWSQLEKPTLPAGERIYCIGDIHGRDDLLQQLHQKISLDAAGYAGSATILYLGDYIDRGDRSKQVIDLLIQHPLDDFQVIYLRGNHEQTLLDFLFNPDVGRSWFNYGGLQTLASYGVTFNKLPTRAEDFQALQRRLIATLPESHKTFFEQSVIHHIAGSYFFVHAGIQPGIKLDQQNRNDMLWIRDAFISHTSAHEKVVVHGHTISDEVDFKSNRIGVDTGAYLSGNLSCLVLEAQQQRVIQTGAGSP